MKLLPQIWNVSHSASDQTLESKWNLICSSNTLMLALGEGGGQVTYPLLDKQLEVCLFYGFLSIYVSQSW